MGKFKVLPNVFPSSDSSSFLHYTRHCNNICTQRYRILHVSFQVTLFHWTLKYLWEIFSLDCLCLESDGSLNVIRLYILNDIQDYLLPNCSLLPVKLYLNNHKLMFFNEREIFYGGCN